MPLHIFRAAYELRCSINFIHWYLSVHLDIGCWQTILLQWQTLSRLLCHLANGTSASRRIPPTAFVRIAFRSFAHTTVPSAYSQAQAAPRLSHGYSVQSIHQNFFGRLSRRNRLAPAVRLGLRRCLRNSCTNSKVSRSMIVGWVSGNTFHFPRMSFLPLLFQRRCLARFRSESLGGVYHSAGHSVVNRQNKKPIHRDIKNRRELCSRFKMMKLCIGFKIQIRSVCRLTNHAGRHCDICWCGNYQLPLAFLKSSFILYSVIFLL